MNMYKEIDQETMELLLDALLKRTLEGKQIWENLYYNPIGFVQQDAYEDRKCLRQRHLLMALNMN